MRPPREEGIYRPADTTPGLTTYKHVKYQSPASCRVEFGPFACIPTHVQPPQGMPLPNPDPEASGLQSST